MRCHIEVAKWTEDVVAVVAVPRASHAGGSRGIETWWVRFFSYL